MNPFRPLLKLLDFVLGHDLQEERAEKAEKKAPVVRPRPPRSQAPQGDGFERGSRGPNVDLGGGRKSAPKLPDEPAGPPAVIEPSNFNASLEDLSHLVNEPMEPRPEFIPEGGMSTESLMREFSSLDSETQAAAVEQAAARELEQSFDEVVDSFESAPASVVVAPLDPAPAPRAQVRVDAATLSSTAQLMSEGHTEAPDFSHLVDAPLEAKPAFVPAGGMSTESLMDEFSSLDAETQAAAVAEAAAKEAAREAAEDEFEEAPEPVPEIAAAAMSTASLMGEFESLDAETQAAAVEQHAAREAARAEAEAAEEALAPHADPLPAAQGEGVTDAVARAEAAKRAAADAAAAAQAAIARAAEAQKLADEAVAQAAAQTAPKPEPTKPERLTPAWLVPATTAAPKKTVSAPAPGLSTESLMSEFESLDADTQQKAIDEAAARELVRQQQEEANRKKAEQVPLPASQGEGEDD